MAEDTASRAYAEIHRMVVNQKFFPGERLNESALAKNLAVTRTTLRAALVRLAADGVLAFSTKGGFSSSIFSEKQVLDFYEFRISLEQIAIGLAIERACDDEIDALAAADDNWERAGQSDTGRDPVQADEQFHERLAGLSRNMEVRGALQKINVKLGFVRAFEIAAQRSSTAHPHSQIIDALRRRDGPSAERSIQKHIEHHLDNIVENMERSYGRVVLQMMNAGCGSRLTTPNATAGRDLPES